MSNIQEKIGCAYLCTILLFVIGGCILLPLSVYIDTKHISSPVEDIQHKEFVTVLDSILDSRSTINNCEEVIDSDDVSVPHTRNGKVMLPIDY